MAAWGLCSAPQLEDEDQQILKVVGCGAPGGRLLCSHLSWQSADHTTGGECTTKLRMRTTLSPSPCHAAQSNDMSKGTS